MSIKVLEFAERHLKDWSMVFYSNGKRFKVIFDENKGTMISTSRKKILKFDHHLYYGSNHWWEIEERWLPFKRGNDVNEETRLVYEDFATLFVDKRLEIPKHLIDAAIEASVDHKSQMQAFRYHTPLNYGEYCLLIDYLEFESGKEASHAKRDLKRWLSQEKKIVFICGTKLPNEVIRMIYDV